MTAKVKYDNRLRWVDAKVNLYDEHDAKSEDMCVVFGCGRHLTLQESLQGNKCSHCLSVLPNAAAADPTKFVSY